MSSHAISSWEQAAGDLRVRHRCDAPLGPLTWYGVGGSARLLARPTDVAQLRALLQRAEGDGPVRVLGKGANLLVADEPLEGIVLQLDGPELRRIEVDAASGRVHAGGGASLERVILEAVRHGLEGIEGLAGIPATMGGALRMNAGGAFGEIGRVVRQVTVVRPDGQLERLTGAEAGFGYRRSALGERLVVAASLQLRETSDRTGLRERLKRVMAYKKQSQPMGARSAGCVFKNPPPSRCSKGAGQLIEEAGLKGWRMGGAEVSTRHANFVVVHPGATAADVLRLLAAVRRQVAERCGVELERELVVWSNRPDEEWES